jgi:hypothetical protein
MKTGILTEIKRLDKRNPQKKYNPYKKYEGKFLNEHQWILYLAFEKEDELEGCMFGSFSECFEYLEQINILSTEAEQLLPSNTSPSEFIACQKDYREKVIKECFSKGRFNTENWAIEDETGMYLLQEEKWEKAKKLLIEENICPSCGLNQVKRYTDEKEGVMIFKCYNPDCDGRDQEIWVSQE